MTNFSKITAVALVAILSLNAVTASAQNVPAQNRAAVDKWLYSTASPVLSRATPASSTNDTAQAPTARKGITEKGLSDVKHKGEIDILSWDRGASNSLPPRRASAIKLEAASPVANPVPTAQIPDAPCGPVTTNPNGDVVASSTSC
jgi:hypothetical protein